MFTLLKFIKLVREYGEGFLKEGNFHTWDVCLMREGQMCTKKCDLDASVITKYLKDRIGGAVHY
jgi:hypothetical protein